MSDTLIGGLLALAGVILGHGLSVLRDRRRESREDMNRHSTAKREAYSRMLAACPSIETTPESVFPGTRLGEGDDLHSIRECLATVELVGSAEVVAAARKVAKAVTAFEVGGGAAGFARFDAVIAASRTFAEAARRDLGVEEMK